MTPESKVAAPVGGHTPGPWEAVKANWDRTLIRHALPGDAHVPGYIAEVNNIGAGYEANARLIAAAPELLEALEALLGNCLDSEGLAAAHAKARAALAKAGGSL